MNKDGYVCVNTDGSILKPDYVSHRFNQILKNNNLRPIRFHDLRHSCASLLLSNKVSMKDIQIWLQNQYGYNLKADGYYVPDGELKFVIEQAGENYNLRVTEDTLNVLELTSGRTNENLPSFQIK